MIDTKVFSVEEFNWYNQILHWSLTAKLKNEKLQSEERKEVKNKQKNIYKKFQSVDPLHSDHECHAACVKFINSVNARLDLLRAEYSNSDDNDTLQRLDTDMDSLESIIGEIEKTQNTFSLVPVKTTTQKSYSPSFYIKDIPIVLDDDHVKSACVRSGIHFGHFLHDISNKKMDVVIKVAIDSIQDLEHEVSVLQHLRSSNEPTGCVELYTSNFSTSPPYMVAERWGHDITHLMNSSNKDIRQILIPKIAEAVHALHNHNIMHGDIKPQNILICEKGAYNFEIRLCDLDNSVILENPPKYCICDAQGCLKYTKGWEAPEVALAYGSKVKASFLIDMFSLGLVIDVFSRQVCHRDTTVLPVGDATDDANRLIILQNQEVLDKYLNLSGMFGSIVSMCCQVSDDKRKTTSDVIAALMLLRASRIHRSLSEIEEEQILLSDLKSQMASLKEHQQDALRGVHDMPLYPVLSDPVTFIGVKDRMSRIFLKKKRLNFVCPLCLACSHSGPNREWGGYEIVMDQPWFKECKPYLQWAALALGVALVVSRIPLGTINALKEAIPINESISELAHVIRKSNDILATSLVEEAGSMAAESVKDLHSQKEKLDEDQVISPPTPSAGIMPRMTATEVQMLRLLLQHVDKSVPPIHSGLMRVHCAWEGSTAWVCKGNCEQKYVREGKQCLKIRHLD